jgi:RNA polymerase sigma factor (TIGR02999 family)
VSRLGRLQFKTGEIPADRLTPADKWLANMEGQRTGDITLLLRAWGAGESAALEQLLPIAYPDLRRLAGAFVRRESSARTLQATGLVNELYVSLIRQRKADFNDRQHFFAVAATLMRRILREYARHRGAQRRGADGVRIPLSDDLSSIDAANDDMIDLDRALDALEQLHDRKARLIELTVFLGCSTQEAATLLGISKATADRDLRFARAWLYNRLASTT